MAHPIYYVPAGDVLPIFFDTYDGGTGASVTMTGLAVTDIEIYKDGSVTQRASDAGYTLLDTDGIDFDGITGIHGFSIDTGDNTDASFYTVGAWFTVVVSSVTVDGQTVNFIAAQFRIMEAETTAGRPLTQTAALSANAITATAINADALTAAKFASDVGTEIGTAVWATAARTLTAIDEDNTTLDLDATIRAAVGLASANLDTQIGTLATAANLSTVAGYLDTEIAAILADTNELQTDWADGGRLDLILDARASQTSVDTIDDLLDTEIGALTTAVADLPTNSELATALGTADDAVLAQVALVKAKTDSLTFTVAGQVDANVQSINDVTITGDGQVGTEFGVA